MFGSEKKEKNKPGRFENKNQDGRNYIFIP